MALSAQVNSPVTNQENSEQKLQKRDIKVQSGDLISEKEAAQMKSFNIAVQGIQANLNIANYSSQRKSPTQIELQEMQNRLEILEKINAQSFEYNLLYYQVGNYDFSRIENLKAAEKLQPNNASVLEELSAYAYIINDDVALRRYLKKLSNQQVFSKDLQLYAENTLQSLPLNAVLISHGEKDTYPLFIQQNIKNTRNDVEIISLDHLQSAEYRKRLKKDGFEFPKNDFVDTQFFEAFMKLNNSKNIVIAGSVPRPYIAKGGKNMKTVGLGLSFNSSNALSDAENQELYEKTLKVLILQHVRQANEKPLLGNYLPFLFSVRNGYITNNDAVKVTEIEVLIFKIAELSGKYQQVKSLLNR
jgi:hypothetical protein